MKYYFIILSIFFLTSVSAQTKASAKTKNSSAKKVTVFSEEASIIAYHTPNRDTLFVANDTVGKLIHNIWHMDNTYKGYNPTIIFVDDLPALKAKREKKKIKSNTTKN